MKKETYDEIEKIVVKDAKDDYFIFELISVLVGVLLVLAVGSVFPNVPLLVITCTGIIAFLITYPQSDKMMQEKIAKKKALMDEVKKDVN